MMDPILFDDKQQSSSSQNTTTTNNNNNNNSIMICTTQQNEVDDDKNNVKNHHPRTSSNNELQMLVRPWISIVIVACSVAIYYTVIEQQQQQQQGDNAILYDTTIEYYSTTNHKNNRYLEEDYNTYNYEQHKNHHQQQQLDEQSQFQSHHDHPIHHKPIYNEIHKNLFPLDMSDYYGFGCAILGLMIAAGGGIGGGGILVPIYILVMGFSPKHAIPLSNITVLGGALANTILNIRKRHPLADRPLIDWDLILVMEPFTVAGALIGAVLNKVLPEILLSVLLVCLLSFTAWSSLKKAIKMFQKETRDIKAAKQSQLTKLETKHEDVVQEEAETELLDNMEQSDTNKNNTTTTSTNSIAAASSSSSPLRNEQDAIDILHNERELQKILDEERTTNPNNLIVLSVMFAVVLSVNILKGGGAFPSPIGITCGSGPFWFANIFLLLWILAVAIFVRQYLVNRYYRKQVCRYQYVDGDIQWDERTTITYPFICCFAGFFAGMFGVGGGIVKGPLMIAMGVHPAVSAASTAAMIFFTAFAATTSFVVFGLLIYDYAVMLAFIGFVSTLVGQIGLAYLMKNNQRNSLIVFSIGGVVLLSAILMTIQSMISMAAGEKHHSGGICGRGD